jgi:hypothetical protein
MMFFKKSKHKSEILPPPPPFPKLEVGGLEPVKKQTKKIKQAQAIEGKRILKKKPVPKIKSKPKKEKQEKIKVEEELEELEKEGIKLGKQSEKGPKKSFFETLVSAKTPEEREAKKKAKGEKKKAREERRSKKKLEKQKFLEQREEVIQEEDILKATEEPLEPDQIKIEKPAEIFEAEQEITKAIQDLKKPKRSLSSLFKFKKTKKQKAGLPEIEKTEEPAQIPEIEPKDGVDEIKNKIHDARSALMDFNLEKAKEIYIKIMATYNNLSAEGQAQVYSDIRELYNERKNAESLNIKA